MFIPSRPRHPLQTQRRFDMIEHELVLCSGGSSQTEAPEPENALQMSEQQCCSLFGLPVRFTQAFAIQEEFRDRKRRLCRFIAKSSMSFESDSRKSRKSMFLHLQVSQTLSNTRVSPRPFSVVWPSITRRSIANAFTACSALLLFHGTSSKSRKVNILSRYLCKRTTSLLVAEPA